MNENINLSDAVARTTEHIHPPENYWDIPVAAMQKSNYLACGKFVFCE
ncbi:MAG: hypothetical protein LBT50_03510 [Prevotellaceae bacterium]|jgi:hypothetical protein|nr:hypothetical protein [Prevotellaceae bacterium]